MSPAINSQEGFFEGQPLKYKISQKPTVIKPK